MTLESRPPATDRPIPWNRWAAVFILLGIGIRIVRYALRLPFTGDEAAICLNIINRDFHGLLGPLDYEQVAPVGFLWLQRAMYLWLGRSEYVFRLVPLITGVGSVWLIWRWAKRIVDPGPAALATGIVAVGIYTVFCATDCKPYSLDLLCSVGMLYLGTRYLRDGQSRWLIALLFVGPASVVFSYPAIFVALGVGLSLLLNFGSMRVRDRLLLVLMGLAIFSVVLFVVLPVANVQDAQVRDFMAIHWPDAFPPANPFKLVYWLIDIHAGNLMNHPFGGKNFASTGSLILFILGIVTLAKNRQHRWLGLLLFPFGFNLLAAILHRYPYGQATRTSMHLAPAIAVLIASGAQRLTQLPRTERGRQNFAGFWVLLLLGTGMGLILSNLRRSPADPLNEAREWAKLILIAAPPEATIAVLQSRRDTPVNVQWYLREQNDRITWDAARDEDWVYRPSPVLLLNYHQNENSSIDIGVTQKLIDEWNRKLERVPVANINRCFKPLDYHEQWDLLIYPPPKSTTQPATQP